MWLPPSQEFWNLTKAWKPDFHWRIFAVFPSMLHVVFPRFSLDVVCALLLHSIWEGCLFLSGEDFTHWVTRSFSLFLWEIQLFSTQTPLFLFFPLWGNSNLMIYCSTSASKQIWMSKLIILFSYMKRRREVGTWEFVEMRCCGGMQKSLPILPRRGCWEKYIIFLSLEFCNKNRQMWMCQ